MPALWWMPQVLQVVPLPTWAGFLYLALVSQLFGFRWNRGLALGGVARVSQVQLLQPLVTWRRRRQCCRKNERRPRPRGDP